ncbi:MAG TPA: L-fucokinase, partial [Armatimonadota bacterium]
MSLGTTPVGEQERSLASELQAARDRNWRLFRALLKGKGAERAPDYLLVTAAHEGQTAGCREELEWRQQELGLIPARTQCLALSDPAGQHVGSGGVTLLALAEVARRALGRAPRSEADYLQAFRGKRVLLIHSGGDSQPIPHESPLGKAFSPLPGFSPIGGPLGRFRETWTAFDELFVCLSVLLSRMREGLVVASGDVVVLLDAASVSFRSGVMGLACPAPAEVGTRQGVFHLSPEGRLLGYHQKPSIHRMAHEGIVAREDGSLPVDVDTGIICLDPDGASGLASLGMEIAFSAGAAEPLDLYRHLLPTLALAPESRLGLSAGWPKRIAAEFGATKLTAHRLEPAGFARFDTTRGFMSAFRHGMPGLTPDPRPSRYASYRAGQAPESPLADLRPGGRGDGAQPRPGGGLSVASWSGACNGSEGAGSLMEWCDLRGEWSLGEGALACDLRRPGVPVHLRAHVVGHRIPVSLPGPSAGQALSVLRLYGVADNPKLPAESANGDGGDRATLFGEPLVAWLAKRGISADDVWPGVPCPDRTLWNARLYPAAEPPQDLRLTLWMQEASPPPPDLLKAWLNSPRVSLEQCFHVVDLVKLRRQRRELQDALELDSWADLLRTDISSDDLLDVASLQHLAPGGSPLERLLEQSGDPLLRARVCRVLADFRHRLAGMPGAGHRGLAGRERGAAALATLREPKSVLRQKAVELEVQAFRHVSDAIRSVWHLELASLALEPGESAVAECPARLDFGGGWSDTPPHSLERGGVVLNAAVALSGRAP